MPPGRPTILANASQAIAGSVWWGEIDPQNVHMELTGSLLTATRLAITAALGCFLFAMTVP